MADTWNPTQYERFRAERAQPFHDLLALVQPRPGMRVIDLGCGTGDMTLLLHQKLAARETLGVDTSAAMLAKAPSADGLRFAEADIAKLSGGPYDLIFSNAALHWLPDHAGLLRRLRSMLAPGGQLAVQMPASDEDAPHLTARELARSREFKPLLKGYSAREPLLEPQQYAGWLHALGFARQHVRVQIYAHLLDDRTQVVEWVRGALLTDYQRRLPPDAFARFLRAFADKLLPQLADESPYLYLQPRLLLWGAL